MLTSCSLFPSLIGLSNFPFKHVIFSHSHNSVTAKNPVKGSVLHKKTPRAGRAVLQVWTERITERDNMSHSFTNDTVCMETKEVSDLDSQLLF